MNKSNRKKAIEDLDEAKQILFNDLTDKQWKAFRIWQSFRNDPDKESWTWKEILKKAGYADSVQPSDVKESAGWKNLLKEVDDEGILKNMEDIAKQNEDKRVAVNAGKEIFKLEGRYPKKGVKVDINQERKDVFTTNDEGD